MIYTGENRSELRVFFVQHLAARTASQFLYASFETRGKKTMHGRPLLLVKEMQIH